MPSSQGGAGRDHNPFVFTNWLCGGGIKGGVVHGESDEFGYKPHLLGIEHERLSFYHNGIERRLTDVHGHVLQPLLT
jgi:hypothetical protein